MSTFQDLQSAWLLLLYCANTRANYWLRGVLHSSRLSMTLQRSRASLGSLAHVSLSQDAQDLASLPCSIGGCGLRSASRSKVAAHWASWADSLRMVHQRHPDVAALMVRALFLAEDGRHLQAAESCRLQLFSLGGFVPPTWHAAAEARSRFIANVEHFGNETGVPCPWVAVRGIGQCGEFLLPPLHRPTLFSSAALTVFPLPFTSGLTWCSFAFFSCVVFVFLFRFRLVLAGVAVLSTSLATTVQRARLLGCLEDVDSRFSLLRHASAAKLRLVSPPMFSCGTWASLLLEVLTVAALKWSRRGCSHSTGLSWPSTLLWSLLCALMECHTASVPPPMVPRNCGVSSVSLPAQRSGPRPSSSVLAPSSPGTSVGDLSSLALPRELWHLRSSRTAGVLARMARRHQRAMS